MPFELTQHEKDLIIAKHEAMVDEFNQYLPEGTEVEYDKNLIDRLNDPKEVEYYKTLEVARTRIEKQKQIYNDLEARFGAVPKDKNFLNRSFAYGFKTEDTKEAREYNENLYKEYQKNPDAVLFKRYKKVMEFNPEELINALDDKQKIAEFYLKNQRLCEDAFVFVSVMENPNAKINPELRALVDNIGKTVEKLSYPMDVVKRDMGDTYFTFPRSMTQEQAATIMAENPLYFHNDSPYRVKFNDLVNPESSTLNPKESFQQYVDNGLIIGKDFFLKYKALSVDVPGEEPREISLDEGIERINEEGISIVERTPEELREIRKINGAYKAEYLNLWKEKFSRNFNQKPFDYDKIKDAHKGNFVERLLGKTSREYNEFINQLKEYNDPNSPDYMNKDKLRERAQAYYDHKAEQGISFNKMDATGRGRLKLVSAVIQTIDQMEDNELRTENQVYDRLREPQDIVREEFLKEKDVADNVEVEPILEDAPVLENNIEMKK